MMLRILNKSSCKLKHMKASLLVAFIVALSFNYFQITSGLSIAGNRGESLSCISVITLLFFHTKNSDFLLEKVQHFFFLQYQRPRWFSEFGKMKFFSSRFVLIKLSLCPKNNRNYYSLKISTCLWKFKIFKV